MTLRLRPYPRYRDSKVPWLGKIPSHWTTERGKWLFKKLDRPIRDSDEVITCFRDGMVTLRKNRRIRGFTESIKEIGYQGIRKGDLVIHAMDAFAGAVGVSDSDGKGTPVYSVCRPLRLSDPRYYAYVVREMARSEWILALAKGIRERSTDFRFDAFAAQSLPIPAISEQQAIVSLLQRVDRTIQRLVHTKQRLIELLDEQKQVIIHRAVTRGLDPSVPMKPSGVEWLGDIPKHWNTLRTKFVYTEIDQRSESGLEAHLSMSQKKGLVLSSSMTDHVLHSESYVGGKLCKKGDAVLNRLKAHLGVFALAPQAGLVSPDYSVFRLKMPGNPTYFIYALKTPHIRTEFRKRVKGIVEGLWRLYTPDFFEIKLPIPPGSEQRKIATEIESFTAQIVHESQKNQSEIKLLQEYKTRLIADVVTGKLDVRNVDLPAVEDSILEHAEALTHTATHEPEEGADDGAL